jgi:hypothetical protein
MTASRALRISSREGMPSIQAEGEGPARAERRVPAPPLASERAGTAARTRRNGPPVAGRF